jgi:signal transduction histidine kinase
MVTLESSALFQPLPEPEKAALRASVSTRSYPAGREIFKEGDPGDGVYVVRAGRVAISARLSGGGRRVFSDVGAGDFFGEMAVLDQLPRSATATAVEDTELYFIPREQILALLTRAPGLSMALLQQISQRMREFNHQYFREVLQAERMALIGRFASAIVHDLKNPLTIIGITAEMACLEDTPPEARKTSEQRIHRQIDRITGMVNDILEFTRGSGGPVLLTAVEYGSFVRSVLEEIKPEVARKSVHLELATEPPAVKIRLHPHRMTRVFYNLIFNAVDEMPQGGQVTLRFEVKPREVITEISDSGKGIAPEIIDRLFEPFETHGKIKGTGLGLSITRRIIEEHGGRIQARNEAAGGAVFSFSLPLPEPPTTTVT